MPTNEVWLASPACWPRWSSVPLTPSQSMEVEPSFVLEWGQDTIRGGNFGETLCVLLFAGFVQEKYILWQHCESWKKAHLGVKPTLKYSLNHLPKASMFFLASQAQRFFFQWSIFSPKKRWIIDLCPLTENFLGSFLKQYCRRMPDWSQNKYNTVSNIRKGEWGLAQAVWDRSSFILEN